MTHYDLTIRGMSCGHCVMAVKKALESVAGARTLDVQVGHARVDGPAGLDGALRDAIVEADYEVAEIRSE